MIMDKTNTDNNHINLDLSQAVKSTQPTHWDYIAEGAANLILAYRPPERGGDSRLRGKCLRLSKRANPQVTREDINYDTQTQPVIAQQLDFHHQILSPLISPEHLLQFELISLDDSQRWLEELAANVQLRRPSSKRDQTSIDSSMTLAIIIDNLASENDGCDQPTISVEIKPKWACLPQTANLLELATREIKNQFCRTCVFRAVRSIGSTGSDEDRTEPERLNDYYLSPDRFCALQLFSSRHPAHLRQALDRLRAEWQHQTPSAPLPPSATTTVPTSRSSQSHNNLKIFRHGVLLDPSSVEVDPQLIEVLAVTLERSGLLRRLADLQRQLDMLDIEGVFAQIVGSQEGLSILEEPITLGELAALVPLLSETVEPTAIAESLSHLSIRTKAVMYALSMTFKDCSIFVQVPVLNHPPSTSSPTLLSPAPDALLQLRTDRVKLIDLDLKPITRLHKYFKSDRAMFSSFIGLLRSSHPSPTTCLELCNSASS